MYSGTLVQNRWAIGAELFPDLEIEARHRSAQLLGHTVLRSSVHVEKIADSAPVKTLQSSLIGARNGVAEDDALTDINVSTEVAERLFNAGHETEVAFGVDEDNELTQNGIKLTEVSINTLKHADHAGIMLDRSRSELHNGMFFNALHQNDLLNDNVAVVFSHTPTDEKVKKEYNFFETDTVSIQLLKKVGDNQYVLQTAFVAGKSAPEAGRQDLDAVKQIALENGVDVMSQDTETMLSQVFIIPKDQLPLGVTSVVQQYDNAVGGTFYGEKKPVEGYQTYSEMCKKRNFNTITKKVKQKLLQEALSYETPMDAIKRLDYWSRQYCLEEAVKDESIDASAFGEAAHHYVQQARVEYVQGNMFEVNRLFNLAKKTDASSSCPFKNDKPTDGLQDTMLDSFSEDTATDNESSGEKEMTCPFCDEKTKGDPCASSITCSNCDASTTCSQSENERRANEYKIAKIIKQQEQKKQSKIIKESKESAQAKK